MPSEWKREVMVGVESGDEDDAFECPNRLLTQEYQACSALPTGSGAIYRSAVSVGLTLMTARPLGNTAVGTVPSPAPPQTTFAKIFF